MNIEEILAALKAIIDGAEGRDLTDEEVERYEKLEGELETAQKASEATTRSAEIRKRQATYEKPQPTGIHVGTPKEDDTLERAFDHYLRTGKENQDLVELRAQGEAAGTEGGYLVPDVPRNKLVERMLAFGGLASHAETINTSSGAPMPWPTIDDTGNVGEIVNEGGTFSSGADLVFGQEELSAYKYMAGGGSSLPLRVSVELLQDAAFDVQGLVTRALGTRLARIQAVHLVRGTGVNEPQGIVTGLTGIELADDTAGVTYNDLVEFIHSVDPAYRDGAMWGFNDASLKTIEKITDSNGDPIWRPLNATMGTGAQGDGGKVGQSGTLLGYPYFVDQAFVDIDVDDNTDNWGVFGNIREGFVIRRVKDVTILVNPYSRMANGQVEYTAWARMDAVQQNTNAYVALTGETP